MREFNVSGKRWRKYARKPLMGMLVLELPMVVGILVLFGIADPDTYRDRLWLDGFLNGFNSSPSQPIYDLVNGKGYHVPLVWSSIITKFNLVISVITVFVLLVKSVTFALNVMHPWLSLLFHLIELGLFAFSVHGQTGPDTIDRNHQNHGVPWYISRSCSVTRKESNVGYCQQAKGAFYLTVFFVVLYSIHVLLALHSILFAPPKPEEDEESFYEAKGKFADEPQWEMVPIPETPGAGAFGGNFPPPTPRTRAFNKLDGAFQSVRPKSWQKFSTPEEEPPYEQVYEQPYEKPKTGINALEASFNRPAPQFPPPPKKGIKKFLR